MLSVFQGRDRNSERPASPKGLPEGQNFYPSSPKARSVRSAFSSSSIHTVSYSPTKSIHAKSRLYDKEHLRITGSATTTCTHANEPRPSRLYGEEHLRLTGSARATSTRTEAAPSPAAREHTREKIKNTYHTKKTPINPAHDLHPSLPQNPDITPKTARFTPAPCKNR